MRHALPSVLLAAAFHALAVGPVSPPEQIVTNDNRGSAGVLRNGVLTIRLEGREGEWHPEGDSEAGIIVRAFAEKGRRLLVPGPLIRVPEGTEIHAYVTNTFARGTLVVHGLSRRGVETNSGDTMQIAPLATREVR